VDPEGAKFVEGGIIFPQGKNVREEVPGLLPRPEERKLARSFAV